MVFKIQEAFKRDQGPQEIRMPKDDNSRSRPGRPVPGLGLGRTVDSV